MVNWGTIDNNLHIRLVYVVREMTRPSVKKFTTKV